MEKIPDKIKAPRSANIENDPRIKGVDERVFQKAKAIILQEKPDFENDQLLIDTLRASRPAWANSISLVAPENVELAEENAAKSIAGKILNLNDKK